MANKVKYGLKNVYYAIATDDGTGALSYSKPVAWKGAVSLSLDAQGDTNNFFADNILYWTGTANSGYQGDFECALIPDSFRTDVLGEEADNDGVFIERAGMPTVEFALLFQFEGDESATRHCLYRCTATRPAVSGQTVEASIEPQTESITLTAMARISDEVVKARCPASASAYANWFTAVHEPAVTTENTNENQNEG